MATFDVSGILSDTSLTVSSISPDYGFKKSSAPRVRTVRFGDGYEQRVGFGLHRNPKQYSLSWSNRSEADIDAMEKFFDNRADNNLESFNWNAPGEPSASRYICRQWDKTIPYSGRATLTATFEEVYEP